VSKPKDEWDKPEKWSLNRCQAIKRNDIYRQEWEAAFHSHLQSLRQDRQNRSHDELLYDFIESSQSERLNALASPSPAEKLCKRWGLVFALPPDSAVWDISSEKALSLFENYGMAVKIIPYGKSFFPPPAQPWIGIKDRYALLKESRYL
jgi:hypothetical protein